MRMLRYIEGVAYHTDREGRQTPIQSLELSHLINIIAFIKRKAKEGITIMYGTDGVDVDDMHYDEDYLEGKEVRKYLGLKVYKKELKRRLKEFEELKSKKLLKDDFEAEDTYSDHLRRKSDCGVGEDPFEEGCHPGLWG